MQNVNYNHKPKQYTQAYKMNHIFNATLDRLFSYPLNRREQHVRAIQRWKRQDVKHRQIG